MRTSRGFDSRADDPMPNAIYEPNKLICKHCNQQVPDDLLICDCNLPERLLLPTPRKPKMKASELPQLPFEGHTISIK